MKKVYVLIMTLCVMSAVYGQKSDSSRLIVSGYLDVYYSFNTNNPDSSNNFGSTGVGRIFDGAHDQVAVGLAQLKLDYSIKKTQVVVDLVYGPNGMLANFGNTGSSAIIKQAYLSHQLMDKLRVTVGQFGTHIGYELVDAPDNFNYSLSYLFGNGPFYHTGAKLDYQITDTWGVMAGVVNGWDAISDNNNSKSFVAQLSVTPNDKFAAYLNWVGGDETDKEISQSGDYYKNLFDLTTTYTISDQWSVGLNAAYGIDDQDGSTKNWGGAALYLAHNLSETAAIGLRAEVFDDSQGVQYLGTSYTGITLTGSFSALNDALIFKPEIRYDEADRDIYFDNEPNSLTDSQLTIGFALIGKLIREKKI